MVWQVVWQVLLRRCCGRCVLRGREAGWDWEGEEDGELLVAGILPPPALNKHRSG